MSKNPEDQKKALDVFNSLRNSIADGMVAQRLGGAGLTSGSEDAIDFEGLE
jgi:hypothetical protein